MTTNDELLKILEKNRDASSQQKIPESSTTIPTTTTTNTITNDELLKILNSNQPSEVQSFTGEYKIDKGGPDKSELMRYGWALETNLVGDLWRLGVAALDSERTIEDIEARRIAKLYENPDFAKFKDGSYDNNPWVWAGRIGVMATDPVYAFMPWARAAQAGKFIGKGGVALFGLGSAVGAGDAAIRSTARTGEIDWSHVALGAGIGGVATAGIGGATKALPALFPSMFGNEKIARAAVEKAKSGSSSLLSDAETLILNSVGKADKVTLAFKNVEATDTALFKILSQKENLSNTVETLTKKLTKLKTKKITKIPGTLTSALTKQNLIAINKAKGNLSKIKAAQKKFLKNWDDTVLKAQDKSARSQTDYYLTVLRELESKGGLTNQVARAFAYNVTRPVVGFLFGGAAGTIWQKDDKGVLMWATAGAGLGLLSRALRSGAVTGIAQNKAQKIGEGIANNFLSNQLRYLNINLSTTTATKLSSHGKIMDEISTLLFPMFMKTPLRDKWGKLLPDEQQPTLGIANNVEDMTREATTFWLGGIREVLGNARGNLALQSEALRIVRGDRTIKASKEATALAGRIINFKDRFKKYYNDVGIKEKNVYDNFFYRKYNYEKINANEESLLAFRKTIVQIFKNKYPNKTKKNPKFAEEEADKFLASVNEGRVKDIVGPDSFQIGSKTKGKLFLPLSEHVKFDRKLQGEYKKVEKLLMDGGWIVDDVETVLTDVVQRSVRSVEFARKFGSEGQFLIPFLNKLEQQYIKQKFTKGQGGATGYYGPLHKGEVSYLADTINGFFGKYGHANIPGWARGGAGILSTLSNFSMMDKVTIANLGDLVQPFVNSRHYLSAFKAMPGFGQYFRGFRGLGTSLLSGQEKGAAQLLDQITYKVGQESIRKTFIHGGPDIAFTPTSLIERAGTGKNAQALNKGFFKVVGLEYITDFARRFAFNAGAIDAHKSLLAVAKVINKGKYSSIDDLFRQNPTSIKHLIDSGVIKVKDGKIINTNELMMLSQFTTPEQMLSSDAGKKFLMKAGSYAMNRDAIIPEVGNRLLFSQSRNPVMRLFGQFSSWAMAKTAQTDAMIARIESGPLHDVTKQATLMALSLVLYGGIKDLRDLVSFGHTRNNSPMLGHPNVNWPKWSAEALQLSGTMGWLPTTIVNQTIGYGSARPMSIAPGLQPLEDVSLGIVNTLQAVTGNKSWEDAYKNAWDLAPFPSWRALLTRTLYPHTGLTFTSRTSVEDSKPLSLKVWDMFPKN